MKVKFLVNVLLIMSLVWVTGCAKPAATVNGKKISKETLDLHVKEKVQDHKLQNASVDAQKLKMAVLRELIDETLILEEASAKGIKVAEDELNKQIDAMKKNIGDDAFSKSLKDKGITPDVFRQRTQEKIIISRFIDGLVKEGDISEQEMNDYYKNSQKPFIKPARLFVKIVEFEKEDAARNAAGEIKQKKADFDEYAKKLNAEKKAVVTDYGWVNPDFFSPDIASAMKALKKGENGGPYKAKSGFYLMRVKDREQESIAKYDEVKGNIKGILLQQKKQDMLGQWLEQKRKASKIVINIK